MSAEETMPLWIKKRAFTTPDRLAITTVNRSLTFAELNEESKSLALRLLTIGVGKQSHVGVLAENQIEMVVLFHALQYLGAVMVPLNTRLTAQELQWQLEDCEASLLVYNEIYENRVHEITRIKKQLPTTSFQELDSLQNGDENELNDSINLEWIQTIIYTSGTTGFPKGVKLTYGNHWWSAISSALNLGIDQQDKWLAVVPLFHVSGLSILVKSVIYGMTVSLHSKFDPSKVNEEIKHKKVTMISVVSAMLKQLLEQLGKEQYPSTFRCMLLGGGPAPKVLLEMCKDKSIPVFQTYGLSETASQIVTLSPEYMLSKLGSAGKPLFPAQLQIIQDEKVQSPEQPGEIVVKGPNVTRGYLRNEKATKEAIKDGWLYTGDIGYVDKDGFLYVLDRRKDLIISGGENVYPAEIEAVLLKHPSVDDAGVVGVNDETWGQVPAAFVTLKKHSSALNSDELISYCKMLLAPYKVPKYVFAIEELPRNASKKLLRRKLLDYLPINLK